MKIIYENCRLKNYMKEYKCNNLLSYNILHPAVLIYDFHIFITSIYQLIIFFCLLQCSFVKTSLFVCFFCRSTLKKLKPWFFFLLALAISVSNIDK